MRTRDNFSGIVGLIVIGLAAGAGVGLAPGCGSGATETNPEDAGADGYVVILDGGGAIAQPPDGPSSCPGACNYQTNEGCAATQTCFPQLSGDGTVPACTGAGQGMNGTACSALADCAPGFVCTSPTDGVCRKLCCGGDWTGCADEDERCLQRLSLKDPSGKTVSTDAYLCVPANNCDALNPTACPVEGQTCQIIDGTGATLCLGEGTSALGEPCSATVRCKGGSVCVAKACRRLCKAVEGGGEPYCQEGEGICVHYNRDPQDVGECTPQ